MDDDSRFSYFFLGIGLGVAAGLLLAPKAGSETRELIRSKADEGQQFIKRRGGELKDSAGDLVDRGRDMLSGQKDQLKAAVEAGKQAYRDAVSGPDRVGGETV